MRGLFKYVSSFIVLLILFTVPAMAVPNAQDLKNDLTQREVNQFSSGGDRAFESAVTRAKVWAMSEFGRAGKPATAIEWENPIVRQAVLSWAKYELYGSQEIEGIAADKKETAILLLSNYLGIVAGGDQGGGSNDEPEIPPAAVARVYAGSVPEWLAGYRKV